MTRYYEQDTLNWIEAPVRGGTVMQKSIVHEGKFDIRSAFYRMTPGMSIPEHMHPRWVQVMVLEGEMEIENEKDGKVTIAAGGCYFVEPGETHAERALRDTLVLVTQAEDRQ